MNKIISCQTPLRVATLSSSHRGTKKSTHTHTQSTGSLALHGSGHTCRYLYAAPKKKWLYNNLYFITTATQKKWIKSIISNGNCWIKKADERNARWSNSRREDALAPVRHVTRLLWRTEWKVKQTERWTSHDERILCLVFVNIVMMNEMDRKRANVKTSHQREKPSLPPRHRRRSNSPTGSVVKMIRLLFIVSCPFWFPAWDDHLVISFCAHRRVCSSVPYAYIHNRCSFHFQRFRRKWIDQHSSANKRNAILLRFLQRKQKLALFCFEYSMATVRQSGSHPACVCVCVYAVPTKVKQTSESS